MTEAQPAAPIVESLGVTFDLGEDDQVTEVLILGKVSDFESGETGLVIGASQGADWITQRGLLDAARHVLDGV